MAAPQKRPYTPFRFKVEIDGLTLGHFQSISGLNHEHEVLEFQEGGVNDRLHKLPGQGRYPNLTLKLGYLDATLVAEWHTDFSRTPKKVGRKNGSIVMLDQAGKEVSRWNFTRAWPVKWEGPDFDVSKGSQILIESVEIAHEGITRG